MDDKEKENKDESKAMKGFNDEGGSIENEAYMTDNRIEETKDWVDNLEKELHAEENLFKGGGEATEDMENWDFTSDKVDIMEDRFKPEKETENLGNAVVDVGRRINGITIMKAAEDQDVEEPILKEEEQNTNSEKIENVSVDLMEFDYSESLVETKVKSNRESNRAKRKMTQPTKVECSKCGKTFTTKFSLELHTKSVHLGIKEHCLFCDMTFSQITNMRTHMKKHHSEEWTKHKSLNRDKVEC